MSDSTRNLRIKLSRALDLVVRADAAAPLLAVAPLLKDASDRFYAADKAAREAALAFAKEAPEADLAMTALAASYDTAREVALVRLGAAIDLDPSSSHTTPTETLEAAVIVADLLGERGADWGSPLLADLQPKLDAAQKEVDEKVSAGAALQVAQGERAAAAGVAWERVQQVRRIVRRVHGPSSRYYHSLRDHARGGDAEPGETSETGEPAVSADSAKVPAHGG